MYTGVLGLYLSLNERMDCKDSTTAVTHDVTFCMYNTIRVLGMSPPLFLCVDYMEIKT